jgi:hypothetical protein
MHAVRNPVERTCEQIDDHHQDQRVFSAAFAEDGDLVVEGRRGITLFRKDEGDDTGNRDADSQWNVVETPAHKPYGHIQDQKNDQWKQPYETSFSLFRILFIHENAPSVFFPDKSEAIIQPPRRFNILQHKTTEVKIYFTFFSPLKNLNIPMKLIFFLHNSTYQGKFCKFVWLWHFFVVCEDTQKYSKIMLHFVVFDYMLVPDKGDNSIAQDPSARNDKENADQRRKHPDLRHLPAA